MAKRSVAILLLVVSLTLLLPVTARADVINEPEYFHGGLDIVLLTFIAFIVIVVLIIGAIVTAIILIAKKRKRTK